MIRRILVICHANICRSPMAEGLFRKAVPGAQICSAGMSALVGHGADQVAVQMAAEAGIDITSHRARMLTDAITRDADLILVMDDLQRKSVLAQYPYARGKVFRLAETAKQDIPDPYQQSPEVFHAVFSMIQNGVEEWAKRINSIG